MERNPGTPAEPESDRSEHSTSPEKDSTRKKRRRVGSAAAASTTSETTTSAQETTELRRKVPSALEQALAQLATEERRQKAAEEAAVTSDTSKNAGHVEETHEEPDEESADFEAANEFDDESKEEIGENAETYEPLVDYGVGATEFSGGEVVIDLGGSSIEEHVVPLVSSEAVASSEVSPQVVTHEQDVYPVTAEVEPGVISAEVLSAASEATPANHDMLKPLPVTMPAEVMQQQPVQATETLDPIRPDVSNENPVYNAQPEVAYLQHQTSVEEVSHVMPSPNVAQTPYLRPSQTEQVINKADFEDAIYRATKTGQNRGVAAGLLAGAGYEHFKHKRREKRVAKKHQETTKKLAEARKSLAFTTEQQVKQRAEYTTQADDSSKQLAETQRRVSTLEQQREIHPVAERPAVVPVANVSKMRPEQAPQPAVEAEPLAVAPEHRLQTSAWHTIEVDARTGRAVEKPVFEYGHEYYREQAQENALGLPPAQDTSEQKPPTKPPVATHDAPRSAAAFGGSSLPPMYNSTPSQPAAQTAKPTPASPKPVQPQPTNVPPATKIVGKPTQPASPIWPLVLALVVVVICLSLALR
jgi:hypothetical protein